MNTVKRVIARTAAALLLAVPFAAAVTTASADEYLLNASFESGADGFSARSGETVERASANAYDGQYCLQVSNRTDAWNGAAVVLGTAWQSGETYSFSCAVRQDSGAPVDMQLSLQYNDASGETNYAQIAALTVESGAWTILENTDYTIPTGASDRYLYIETVDSLCDFYVDAVQSAKPVQYQRGDVNHDMRIDRADVYELMQFVLTKSSTVSLDTADMNQDGVINSVDISLLRQLFLYPELTSTTTTVTTTVTTVTTTVTTAITTVATQPPMLRPGQWNNTADISWIDSSKPTVAICFDDGPVGLGNTSAQRIMDALTNSGFHSTFFYWGNRINGNNENEIVESYKRGFEIANHTFTHPYLTNLGPDGIMSEYNQCASILTRLTGLTEFLVRPPYLATNDTVKSTLPVPLINCGVDSGDWNNASVDDMVNKMKSGMANGTLNGQVVLMHETYDSTAQAMEILCPYMKENGWQIVTVSEMFKVNGKDLFAGNVYNNCW